MESPELKLKKPADTRWLSHDNTYQTLVREFPAICVSKSREAEERGDTLAFGLGNNVRKYDFVASLYMMCNILPAISHSFKLCFAVILHQSFSAPLSGFMYN